LKNNVQDGVGICGLAVLQGRLEVNLFGGTDRAFIQTVPESPDYSYYSQLARSLQHDFQQNLTFYTELARFFGISWIRLRENLCW
jgi:hypothetical protein